MFNLNQDNSYPLLYIKRDIKNLKNIRINPKTTSLKLFRELTEVLYKYSNLLTSEKENSLYTTLSIKFILMNSFCLK
jgi:hypothetical protein